MTPRPALSVVVPAFREERRIGACVESLVRYFRSRKGRFEVIVVNDGSPDDTLARAREAARRFREVRVVSYRRNGGKGFALRRGIAATRGDRVLFLDADLSTRPAEWPKLAARLDRGADVAVGSRKMAGAHLLRRQPWWRERMGKVFTWLVRRFLVNVSDATCGFKAFRGPVARELFRRSRLNDWSYDAEILFLAQRGGCVIAEVPVVWKDNPDSKVRVLGAALGALGGLLRVRWNHALGRYGDPASIRAGVSGYH